MSNEGKKKYPADSSGYVLQEELGEGAFAVVYKAQVKETKEWVAIKILNSQTADWEDISTELTMMHSMEHPNVISVYSSFFNTTGEGEDQEQELWIVMPLLEVGSCSSILKEFYPDGIKDPAVLATILKSVCQALVYIHKDGKIHRDVKAGNILLSSDGQVKLGDFGVSATLVQDGIRRTMRNTFVGTPCWMAPEVMESEGYDMKADIWSFGITAMELAYGYPPYAHEQKMKVLINILRKPPPMPSSKIFEKYKSNEFPSSFQKMIKLCLKRDPKERPEAKKLLKCGFLRRAKESKDLVKWVQTVIEQRTKQPREKVYRDPRKLKKKVPEMTEVPDEVRKGLSAAKVVISEFDFAPHKDDIKAAKDAKAKMDAEAAAAAAGKVPASDGPGRADGRGDRKAASDAGAEEATGGTRSTPDSNSPKGGTTAAEDGKATKVGRFLISKTTENAPQTRAKSKSISKQIGRFTVTSTEPNGDGEGEDTAAAPPAPVKNRVGRFTTTSSNAALADQVEASDPVAEAAAEALENFNIEAKATSPTSVEPPTR